MRFAYRITGSIKFLSHLDMMDVFARAAKRAELPVAYSAGFNPHPKISLGPAHIVGIASLEEWGDMELMGSVIPEEFISRLNRALPVGLEVFFAKEMPPGTPALQFVLDGADYLITYQGCQPAALAQALDGLLAAQEIPYEKKSPKGVKVVDLRPGIYQGRVTEQGLVLSLAVGDRCNVRPQYVVDALRLPDLQVLELLRTDVYIRAEDGGKAKPC